MAACTGRENDRVAKVIGVGVDQEVRELAERTLNFGYLLAHEPLLVAYGATAEAALFTDPNIAMIKCRQFGEALTARAFIQFGLSSMPQKQYQRLKVLSDQGFLNTRAWNRSGLRSRSVRDWMRNILMIRR